MGEIINRIEIFSLADSIIYEKTSFCNRKGRLLTKYLICSQIRKNYNKVCQMMSSSPRSREIKTSLPTKALLTPRVGLSLR